MLYVSALAVALWCAPAWGTLVDRYSFTADGTDSVSGKNATAEGGAGFSGGALQLDGGAEYATLPANILNGFTGLTIEVWFTWNTNTDQTWSRIFDFGSSQSDYIYLTPDNGWSGTNTPGFALKAVAGGGSERDLTAPNTLPVGTETFMAITIAGHEATLYVNGSAVASADIIDPVSSLQPTTNNWLGQSEFANPYFNGSIDEFRIFNDAQSSGQVAFDYQNGPDDYVVPEPSTALLLLAGLCFGAIPYGIRRRKAG